MAVAQSRMEPPFITETLCTLLTSLSGEPSMSARNPHNRNMEGTGSPELPVLTLFLGREFWLSHQATTWVLERSEQEGIEFIVLFVIANHCHPDGSGAYPSIPTIASQARVCERRARYAVKHLEESGELLVHRSLGGVANQEWKSRNDYILPGVIRDGFYTERRPKTDNSQRHDMPMETIPSGTASGIPSGTAVPPNNPLNLEPEQSNNSPEWIAYQERLRKEQERKEEKQARKGKRIISYPQHTVEPRRDYAAEREASRTAKIAREDAEILANLQARSRGGRH